MKRSILKGAAGIARFFGVTMKSDVKSVDLAEVLTPYAGEYDKPVMFQGRNFYRQFENVPGTPRKRKTNKLHRAKLARLRNRT